MDALHAVFHRLENLDGNVSRVPSPEAFEHARALGEALRADDLRWMDLGASERREQRRLRYRQFRRRLELLELELAYARQLRRYAIAASGDWSGLSSYLADGWCLIKCGLTLRWAGYLFRFGIPGASDFSDAAVCGAFRRLYFAVPR